MLIASVGCSCTPSGFAQPGEVLATIESHDPDTQPSASTATATTQPAATARLPNGAVLVCEYPTHDFGEVWSGTIIEHEFMVRNIGTATARVELMRFGVTHRRPEYFVKPGETVAIPVKIDTGRVGRSCGRIYAWSLRPESDHQSPDSVHQKESTRPVR